MKSGFAIFQMIICIALSLLVSATVFAQPVNKAKKNLPNVVYIYADDMGYGVPGTYGQQKIPTPQLDRMAKEGMRFTQHYSGAPVCAPARAMLLTGKHAGHSYIRGNYEMGGFSDSTEGGQMPLPEGTFTIAQLLKNAGYKTALCGKWGLGMHTTTGSPLKHGFDYYYGYLDQKQAHNYYPTHLWENDRWDSLNNEYVYVHEGIKEANANDEAFNKFTGNDYAPDKITGKALSFIDANKRSPFFLYLAYSIPHASLQVPSSYVNEFKENFDDAPYLGNQGYAPTKYPKATYAAMIHYLDEQVGIVMDKIKSLGLDENTIIMFSSDNGPSPEGGAPVEFFNSTGNLRGGKRDLYEGGIRIPFIARWPGKITAGKTSDHISVQYDLMSTLAELTGQRIKETDGVSFLPELYGKASKKREYIYFEYPDKGGQVAIRIGNLKAIKVGLRQDPKVTWQLYDLSRDPFEQKDIAADHHKLLQRFDEILKKEHQCAHIKEWEFIDPKYN